MNDKTKSWVADKLYPTPKEKKESWFAKHWILSIILGLFILGAILGYGSDSDNNSSSSTSQKIKLASLEPEVTPGPMKDVSYYITNRNDYTWHNLTITIDDYYICIEKADVEPQKKIIVNGMNCDNWFGNHLNNPIIQSMKIQADEGTEYYTLQGYG